MYQQNMQVNAAHLCPGHPHKKLKLSSISLPGYKKRFKESCSHLNVCIYFPFVDSVNINEAPRQKRKSRKEKKRWIWRWPRRNSEMPEQYAAALQSIKMHSFICSASLHCQTSLIDCNYITEIRDILHFINICFVNCWKRQKYLIDTFPEITCSKAIQTTQITEHLFPFFSCCNRK